MAAHVKLLNDLASLDPEVTSRKAVQTGRPRILVTTGR
jgi:hypothetical protein